MVRSVVNARRLSLAGITEPFLRAIGISLLESIPILGDAVELYQIVTGVNLGSMDPNARLTAEERLTKALFFGLSVLPIGDALAAGGKMVSKTATRTLSAGGDLLRHGGRHLDEAAGSVGMVSRHGDGMTGFGRQSSVSTNSARMAEVRRAGRVGEAAAGITGPKRGVLGPLSGRMRYPDTLTATVLKESKNVARQGWTAQLKDYAAIAKSRGIDFELWVRQSTMLSKQLQAARDRGDVIIRFFERL